MDFNIRLAKRSYARGENFGRTQGAKEGSLCELCKEKIFPPEEHGANSPEEHGATAGFQEIVSSSEGRRFCGTMPKIKNKFWRWC